MEAVELSMLLLLRLEEADINGIACRDNVYDSPSALPLPVVQNLCHSQSGRYQSLYRCQLL
jgi:hypothetical protein